MALVLVTIALTGCAHKKNARRASLPPPPAPAGSARPAETAPATPRDSHSRERAAPPLAIETGIASWYGYPYHGRQAANGEIYDMEKMTAAHRTLPFDTIVRVVNLNNQESVEVRITDRGPFVDGRIIDLSHAAAKAIDMLGPGIAPVRMEIVNLPETAVGVFAVQVGAFRNKTNAERLRAKMADQYGSAKIVQRADTPGLWRVLVGSEKTEQGADALRLRIQQESGERIGFVVRLDS